MRRRTGVGIGVIVVALVAVALIAGLAGGHQSSHRQGPGAFAWLHPVPPPAGWKAARIRDGATLPYPPGWKRLESDAGTATVALLSGGNRIAGYLNATPKEGPETLTNWSSFRPEHNRDEGDQDVRLIASARDLHFRSGPGSCVIDDYTTSKATYREIACLASGPRSSAVVVAAAPTSAWQQEAATLRRAVSGFAP
ncbi:MAG: hypothetical protein ACJ75Z_14330 [Solirubrobacterales bacterium]